MRGGYTGKFLNIDLSAGNIRTENTDEKLLKRYISGRGLAAKLLYDRMPEGAGALEPENIIVLAAGVL